MPQAPVQPYLDLADWRRRVGDLYRLSGPDALTRFRHGRDELFRTHPQSPLGEEARTRFTGLRYFDHDPSYQIRVRVEPADAGDPLEIDTGGEDGVITYRRAGWLRFGLGGQDYRLTVFSLVGYGGGLFLSFRDATSGTQTYGGGRYVFDCVLVARSHDKLNALAARMESEFRVKTLVLPKDLSKTTAVDEIYEEVSAASMPVDVLVNNAGFPVFGLFAETDLETELEMLQVNVVALTKLTKLFLSGMIARRYGRILNLA